MIGNKKFEQIEHTADVGIKAFGKTLEELFESSAYGMFSVMLEQYENFSGKSEISIETSADNLEDLLVNWLQELLYRFEVKSLVFSNFHVKMSSNVKTKSLIGSAGCDHYNKRRYGHPLEIKAVTYHNLEIKTDKGLYSVEIIFDV
jgi:SHS2 domain-containing protein